MDITAPFTALGVLVTCFVLADMAVYAWRRATGKIGRKGERL